MKTIEVVKDSLLNKNKLKAEVKVPILLNNKKMKIKCLRIKTIFLI